MIEAPEYTESIIGWNDDIRIYCDLTEPAVPSEHWKWSPILNWC